MSKFDINEEDFYGSVVERSYDVPVLVDFWAPWCGPCRIVGPVLEAIAEENPEKFALVKVNTEESRRIAAEYRISSIPAVKLFRDGKVIDEFVGALPRNRIESFLSKHWLDPARAALGLAASALADGDIEAAATHVQAALAANPDFGQAHLLAGKLAMQRGDLDVCESHLTAVRPSDESHEAAAHLRDALVLARECQQHGGLVEAERNVSQDPSNVAFRYARGCCYATNADYPAALDDFLFVVAKDRRFRDDAGRKGMLTVFGLAGPRSPLADEYRRKLAVYI